MSICVYEYKCVIVSFAKELYKGRCSGGVVFTCVCGGSVCMSICVYKYM